MKPEQLKYSKTHEWAYLTDEDGQRIATVGISSFAVEALTDLVYLELPAVGTEIDAGEAFGEVESVKAVSDLYSPIAGEVIETNDRLPDNLETLSEDPYGAGWIVKLKVSDESALAELMDYAAYEKLCAEEQV